ncbi:flavin prenyltransferase UbiX [Marispirochaeta sp.]|uniref:UbiX family flavin prenyltransferase n=1 Tax=Marispirochaeta sp. TaxID=2038653 RepID=UPI0029C7485D|nr:flavin prenyltransferase UbiX [Marispirochaeta sp.]
MPERELPLIVAITGASGAVYGLRLVQLLLEEGVPLYLLLSKNGEDVILQETGRKKEEWLRDFHAVGSIATPETSDFFSPIASGSFLTRGMLVAPCSMGALGRIASGTSDTLVERAADVSLKERRPLVLLTRETPLSSIHLENMLKITRAGGIIMPPVPAFYTQPKTIDELVDQSLCRVLDLLGLPSQKARRWNSGQES